MPTNRNPLGRYGERVAARWLSRRGYRVLGRNLEIGSYEVDLLCRAPARTNARVTGHEGRNARRDLVLVEVKTRRSEAGGRNPEAALTHTKRQHLLRAAEHLIQANQWHDQLVRIDLVAVVVVDPPRWQHWWHRPFSWPFVGPRTRPTVRHHTAVVDASGRLA